MIPIDWRAMFVPTHHPGEMIVRGTIMYLGLFVCMRLFRREAGAIGISDLLVVVLIADAAQNAMAREYESITEGMLLVGTIVFWNYVLDWLSFRFPALRPLLKAAPLQLITNGEYQYRNMRQELISKDELQALLREQGVEDVADVKQACLEANGHVSVVKKRSRAKASDEGRAPTRRGPAS